MNDKFDLGSLGEMLNSIQSKAKEIEERSKSAILTAKAGGGMVKVSANGAGEIIDITIDDSILEDKESLQILLISAINDVNRMVDDNRKSQAMGVFEDLNPFGHRG